MLGKVGSGVIASGTATKDAECKTVGQKNSLMCTFSIAAGKRQDTTTIFVNCKAWRKNAEVARGIRKGDPVFVAGVEEEFTAENGKTYKTLTADFVAVGAAVKPVPMNALRPAEAPFKPAVDDFQQAEEEDPF